MLKIKKIFLTLIIIILVVNAFEERVKSPPTIIKQPTNKEILFEIVEGEIERPFLIECEAEGEPAPRYRWTKNGLNFIINNNSRINQMPNSGTIFISRPDNKDAGYYQCFAENELGVAMSNSVLVKKTYLNSFRNRMELESVNAEEGKQFKLDCNPPDGYPKPEISWLFENQYQTVINNSRMTIDANGDLLFSYIDKDDDKYYYVCIAMSPVTKEYQLSGLKFIKIKKDILTYEMYNDPMIQYAKQDAVAIQGEQIKIFCIFGGTPVPDIYWTKNGKPMRFDDRITLENYNKSIKIGRALIEDGASYTCEAYNGGSRNHSYSTNLEIFALPHFIITPENTNTSVDEFAVIQCEAFGIPKPTVQWYYNGRPIDQAADPNNRRIINPTFIQFQNITSSDIGNYGCNASNALGYVYKDVYLNVLALPPEAINYTEKFTVVDSDVTLFCIVSGVPRPEIKWYRNNKLLSGYRYIILDYNSIKITNIRFDDAGNYTCIAKNKYGTKNETISLIVKNKTEITLEIVNNKNVLVVGEPVSIKCEAITDSSLNVTINWIVVDKENQIINITDKNRIRILEDYSLTISSTAVNDTGNYSCIARTSLDEVTSSIELTIQNVPNSPELISVQCNNHDATISWRSDVDNNSPIIYYTIEYNTSFTPDQWNVAFKNVPVTELTYNVGMSPWTNYTYRIIAYNEVGGSEPSIHSDICTTRPDVPHKNPENVEGKGTQPNNLVITWTAMPPTEHNGQGFYYKITYNRDTAFDQVHVRKIYNWKHTSLEILDQPSFQRYRIRVMAINNLGEANVYPREIIGYSSEDVPLEAPEYLCLIELTGSTSAIFTWKPVTIESIRGHFKGYKIETWNVIEGELGIREHHVEDESNVALVHNLKSNTVNYARVYVYNGKYYGPGSNVIEFTTPEGLPTTVEKFEVVPLGPSILRLKWKEPWETNGEITGYNVYHQITYGNKTGKKIARNPQILDPRARETVLDGLKPNQKYRIYVAATTKLGEGKLLFIDRMTRDDPDYIPDTPLYIIERIRNNNGTANIKVKWLNANDAFSGLNFFIKYKISRDEIWLETPKIYADDEYIIEGLDTKANYLFQMFVSNNVNEASGEVKEINFVSYVEPWFVNLSKEMETTTPLSSLPLFDTGRYNLQNHDAMCSHIGWSYN